MGTHVTVNITRDTLGVARTGFGTALFLSNTASWVERTREYTDLAGVEADFPSTTSPEYLCAQAYFSQDVHPEKLKIGRAALPATQVCVITPTAQNSTVYTVLVEGDGVTATECTYTSDASATVAEITAGLEALISAVVGNNYTAVDGSTEITMTGDAAGEWFSVSVNNPALLQVELTHADPGIATDLAAIDLEDDDWYCLLTAFNSNAVVLAADAWIQSNTKVYLAEVNETEAATTTVGNSDTLDDLATLLRARTAPVYHHKPSEFFSAAWAAARLSKDPGSATWKYVTNLNGITTGPKLTATQRANLIARNANFYEQKRGVKTTVEGTTADSDFIDVQIGIDALEDDMSARIFEALASNDKVPFTDAGITMLEGEMKGSLSKFVSQELLAADPAPKTIVPKAADISTADKAARTLTGLKFEATLAGAVHKVNITGVVNL